MKMSELRTENESLKKQLALLSEQKDGEKDSTAFTELKEKNRSLRKSNKELKAEKVGQINKIQTLENDLSLREQDNQRLKEDIEQIQQQLTELSNVHTQTITDVESLRVEQRDLREKETQLQIMQPELDRLQQVENICNEKTAQVDALQAELAQQGQLLAEARAEAAKQVADYQNQIVKLNNEMEMVRNRLQAELDAQREQSGAEIASLQSQKSDLSAQIAELTEKLKLVAKLLERQLIEKRKIVAQYDTTVKEYQAYKVKTEKEGNDLMALMQKLAIELDASRASHPAQENLPSMMNRYQAAIQGDPVAAYKQLQQQVEELRNQLSTLNEINAQQTNELTVLSKRMERIKAILATPQGRVFSRLFGLKD